MAPEARIDRLDVSAYIIPTDFPEQDGTADWDKTVLVLARVHGSGRMGLGYSYAALSTALSTARLIDSNLKTLVEGGDALSAGAAYAAMAISAVGTALWDKAVMCPFPPTHPRLSTPGSKRCFSTERQSRRKDC
jgi:hypothetical protein